MLNIPALPVSCTLAAFSMILSNHFQFQQLGLTGPSIVSSAIKYERFIQSPLKYLFFPPNSLCFIHFNLLELCAAQCFPCVSRGLQTALHSMLRDCAIQHIT